MMQRQDRQRCDTHETSRLMDVHGESRGGEACARRAEKGKGVDISRDEGVMIPLVEEYAASIYFVSVIDSCAVRASSERLGGIATT